jgi:hypothetical protein
MQIPVSLDIHVMEKRSVEESNYRPSNPNSQVPQLLEFPNWALFTPVT